MDFSNLRLPENFSGGLFAFSREEWGYNVFRECGIVGGELEIG